MAKESDTSSRLSNSEILMEKIIISTERQVTLDGMMTIGMLENELIIADFMCCEDVEMQAFSGTFKVEGKRDGNVYMTQKPRRVRNKAIFRDDNASLSQGQDKRWYFYFSLDENQLEQLPEKLVRQASAIAQKVIRELIKGRGYRL
jgi:hypothetical protein